MSNLTEMKSVYDRQVKGVEGSNVGVTSPSDGNFYTNEGSSDSPFDSDDHMVDLLTKDVLSENLDEGIRDFIKTNKDKLQNLFKNFKEAWNDQKGSFKGYKGFKA